MQCPCIYVCLPGHVFWDVKRQNFTKFSVHVTRGCGSVLVWQQCNMLSTSDFVDYVMLSCPNTDTLMACELFTRAGTKQLVAWSSGRPSVFGRRAFAVLRLTCSWWVTTYVGKPSAIGQPTRPTQPFILSGVDKWVVSCNWMSAASVAVVVTSGERSQRKGRHGVICR